MKNSRLFPVALMYVEGTGVDGAIRMQKLVFLAQQETDLPEAFEFDPGPYGPYSYQLDTSLDKLADEGLVKIEDQTNGVGNDRTVYRLTEAGIRVAKKIAKREELSPYLDIAVKIKRKYGDKRLDPLLDYVYSSYPEYTEETELDTDRLSSQRRSQFLEPGVKRGESKYVGVGPEEGHEIRSSAEELFSLE